MGGNVVLAKQLFCGVSCEKEDIDPGLYAPRLVRHFHLFRLSRSPLLYLEILFLRRHQLNFSKLYFPITPSAGS